MKEQEDSNGIMFYLEDMGGIKVRVTGRNIHQQPEVRKWIIHDAISALEKRLKDLDSGKVVNKKQRGR